MERIFEIITYLSGIIAVLAIALIALWVCIAVFKELILDK
jgi:hypothetical protein